MNLRWREQRGVYRPAGETIRTAEYDVAPLAEDRVARAFVVQHHYSGTYPAARVRVGLYHRGALVGVAVFSHPCANTVLTRLFPGVPAVELGRFVLLDSVPGNGETWFLARCFAELRARGFGGVVSFSDPVPRQTAEGRTIFAGHLGTIYQAGNARYLGRSEARTLHLLPDGRVFPHRATTKIRNGERGWRYASARLEAYGAPPAPTDDDARGAWLTRALAAVTRPLRHGGNHRYAWGLTRAIIPHGSPRPYPKVRDAA